MQLPHVRSLKEESAVSVSQPYLILNVPALLLSAVFGLGHYPR